MTGHRVPKLRRIVMVIIAIFGGLFLGGAALAFLKRGGELRDSRKTIHIL
jgi:uncharacterized protein involved in exopolysaccharide biosynthesis